MQTYDEWLILVRQAERAKERGNHLESQQTILDMDRALDYLFRKIGVDEYGHISPNPTTTRESLNNTLRRA